MTRRKKITLGLVLVLVAIQFIRPNRNASADVSKNAVTSLYPVPDSVHEILQAACFDCHSNNTRYPWYSQVQPFGWWLAHHIKEGKAELNFDEFGSYSERRRVSKLRSIQNSVKDGSMPLASYTWIHTQAKMTEERKATLLKWTTKMIDSLTRK